MKLTDVTTGRRARPQKVMIYGVEGIGKSTLASQFPNPIFLDVEDRTAHLDIHRLIPKNWNQMQAALQSLYDEEHGYQTVVVDTADWAEMLAAQDVCERFNKSGIEDFGYGKGFQYVRESVQGMLWALHNLQYKHGMHVVVAAHARIRKFDDPPSNAECGFRNAELGVLPGGQDGGDDDGEDFVSLLHEGFK